MRRLPAGIRELGLVLALFLVYKFGRMVTSGDVTQAFDYAGLVWSLERLLHLPDEVALQQALLPHEALVKLANSYYAFAHFPVTAAMLLWAWFRDRAAYVWIRQAMVLLTLGALLLHMVAPLAPPRMMSAMGFVDTGEVYGQSVYDSSALAGLANQIAAMPSLHVGWAAVVALAVVTISRSRWRFLILLHPVATALVVVVTANHWWLDGIVSGFMLAVAVALVRSPGSRPARPVSQPTRSEFALG